MKRIFSKVISVVFLCVTVFTVLLPMPIFGVELAAGQRLYLNGESYIVGGLLGLGGSAHVYQIWAEKHPSIQFAMRSPLLSTSNHLSDEKIVTNGLNGYNLVFDSDPQGRNLLWAHKIYDVQLNPHRVIFPSEEKLGWNSTHTEPVIVMPLAKGNLIQEKKMLADNDFVGRLRLASATYRDVVPELKHFIKSNLVHGDINPRNILVNNSGRAGLSDFEGVVRQGEVGYVQSQNFSALERASEAPVFFPSDLYSLGRTLLWTLSSPEEWEKVFKNSLSHWQAIGFISEIEKKVIEFPQDFPSNITEILNFIRYSLEHDPLKRVSDLRDNVPSMKDLKIPNTLKARVTLGRQSLKIKRYNLSDVIGDFVYNGFSWFNKNETLNSVPTWKAPALKEKDVQRIKAEFRFQKFTMKEYTILYNTEIDAAERLELQGDLTSDFELLRAWAAVRLSIDQSKSGLVKKSFAENSLPYLSYLPEDIFLKIFQIDFTSPSELAHFINFIKGLHQTGAVNEKFLNVLGRFSAEMILASGDLDTFLNSKYDIVKKFFVEQKIIAMKNLKEVSSQLFESTLKGEPLHELLIKHFQVLKGYLSDSQLDLIFQTAINHSAPGSVACRNVLALSQKTSKYIESYIKSKYPGYTFQEAIGAYRFHQQASSHQCLQFYIRK